MKAKKVLALSLASVLAFSVAGCGGSGDTATSSETAPAPAEETPVEAPAEEKAEAPAEEKTETPADAASETTGEVSIDFEDGVFGFAGIDKSVNSASDDSVLSVEDYNGSKALKVTTQGKAAFVGIQADALLGADVSKVATIEMTIGTENPDGTFGACSGNIYAFLGEDKVKTNNPWSVYMENANPKQTVYEVPEGSSFTEGNYIVVSLETDTLKDKGATPANFYIDNIAFKDASGNVLKADTSAEYVSTDTGSDRSNLCGISGAVEFADFAVKGDGWAQDGLEMPQEIIDALVPGSVVEISYTSENGDMWLVMPDATAGWMRVGDGTNGSAYINNSKNIAQITYEQIAEFCGDDVSAWGARMQCEASGAWEVQSVKVGQKAPAYAVGGAVEFPNFAVKGDGWAQDGLEMPQEIIDALVPGSIVEITYSSENGDMWLVMPDATAGWMRVGDGTNGQAVTDGSKCYVTYEQIAEFCGDDVSAWGARMQCEASGAWEVYGVKVGTALEFSMLNNLVTFEGFATKGDGWAQDGFEMPQEVIDALVPGSVVEVTYSSENGDMWIVMPDATAGWMRVGDGTNGQAVANGSVCQVTYEQIAEFCGDDVSAWGARMQCEASGAWEVYSVVIGTAAE